ncbi:hypothetical protein ACHAWO_012319 [Cyclotella atomus]|uniref:PNPLA domain-containing protein n=1 Tax=Cyclotella atomus TaxID=382360 RepID=A0ABD3QI20_9STRA
MEQLLIQWRCDYCLIASFPTYEQASQHEATCPARLNGNGRHRPAGLAPHVNVIEDDAPVTMSETTALDVASTVARSVALSKAKKESGTMWECDACKEYKSTDYDEVAAHEERCGGGGAELDVGMEDDEKVDGELTEEKMNEEDQEDAMKTPEKKKSPKRTKWLCDMCITAVFDTYEEAVEHEKNCTGDNKEVVVTKKKKAKRVKKGESPKSASVEKKSPVETEKKDDVQSDSVQAKRSPKPTAKLVEFKQTMARPPKKTTSPTVKKTVPKAAAASRKKSPKKNQPESSNETQLVDSLAIKTSEMPVKLNKVTTGSEVPQSIDGPKNDETIQPSMEEEVSPAQQPEKQSIEIAQSSLSFIIKTAVLLAPLALTVAYLPKHIFNTLFSSITLPSYTVLAASTPLLLILLCYTIFGLALAITHEGVHHHASSGFVLDILIALRDTVAPPKIDYVDWDDEKQQTPTLREYLNHKDGFSMAFCPAFFGFFAYFGALTALEEETNGRIVPKLDNNGDTECGLKSVAGASAGAMAAVMLAAGIQPRVAADYVCTFNWSMVADPPGLGGLVKGNKFEEFMCSFIKGAAARAEGKDGDVMLEDALVPVAVSGFDLFRMRGTILSKGCMAKAARSSAGFPGLFQPVSWNAEDGKKLLIDGGIRDGLGLNGLTAFPSKTSRVINMAVGDYGMGGSNGLKDLPNDVKADSLVSIAIVNTPMCGPWAMANGPKAVESARKAMVAMLDTPLERGTAKNHFVLRVDASKFTSA